jgi:hypothetical protein
MGEGRGIGDFRWLIEDFNRYFFTTTDTKCTKVFKSDSRVRANSMRSSVVSGEVIVGLRV